VVYTSSEAEEKWGLKSGTVRAACTRGKLKKYIGTEVKQSGSTWLVTKYVMNKEYGEENKMIKNIKDIAMEVEALAKEKGYTAIEPGVDLIKVQANDNTIHSLDFTLRKGNNFAGRASVTVKNAKVEDQTVEQIGDIKLQ